MALSRWTDQSDGNIDSIINNMLDYDNWHTYDRDPKTNEELLFSIHKTFDENQTLTLNGTKITYNLMEFAYEKVRPGSKNESLRSNRIQNINGFILIYTDGSRVQYIINRSNNDSTKTILRKFTNAHKNLQIISEPLNISEDLFLWMIYNVLNYPSKSLVEESALFLKKIIGFKGEAKDRLAEISGVGNRILNQLSTLAFLFENEKVNFIKAKVEYENETIEFSVDLNGNVIIDFDTYTGQYMLQEDSLRNCNLTLLVFLDVLPKIISSYYVSIENNNWNEDIKVNFFTDIGVSISEKIKEKMSKI